MKGWQIRYEFEELVWIEVNKEFVCDEVYVLFCVWFWCDDVLFFNYNVFCKCCGWLIGWIGCFEKGQVVINKGKFMFEYVCVKVVVM